MKKKKGEYGGWGLGTAPKERVATEYFVVVLNIRLLKVLIVLFLPQVLNLRFSVRIGINCQKSVKLST